MLVAFKRARLHGVDCVFHLAASKNGVCMADPERAQEEIDRRIAKAKASAAGDSGWLAATTPSPSRGGTSASTGRPKARSAELRADFTALPS